MPPTTGTPGEVGELAVAGSMAAVAKVIQARATGQQLGDADFDQIRNICRCDTYHRIREAILSAQTKF
jgi:isoquinoline 1-oxidoreductase alpha subunit